MRSRILSWPLTAPLLFSAFVFSLSVYLGVLVSQINPGGAASSELIQELGDFLSLLRELNSVQIMLVIFVNNAIKALLVIILGYTLGIIPLVFLIANGAIIGLLVGTLSVQAGPWASLPALAPHGVLELPALLVASALGFRVAMAVIGRIIGKPMRPGRELKNGLLVYAWFVLPALFVSALIESFVTPLVIAASR